ncbi:MAG: cysteine desulfurase [Candidatus Liptonbacteria bacterium]|nr:cysteine desulfurase [Candidatus Liptonbacteria bacterium]
MTLHFMKRIYLDYASTTPIDPVVKKAMEPYFGLKFGNTGSLHSFGQAAMSALDESRETIAKAIGANFNEIIFTGSATEANNLAIRGIAKGYRVSGMGYSGNKKPHPTPHTPHPRIVVSGIEHESVLETARDLEREGVEVVYIPVDKSGIVNLEKLEAALNERTVLVSVMYANNEVGTVEPVAQIAEIIRKFREEKLVSRKDGVSLAQPIAHPLDSRPRSATKSGNHARSGSETLFLETSFSSTYPMFHTDAAQALQYLDCDVGKLGVDLMTISAHKIYGPKGIGALYARQGSGVQGLGYSAEKKLNPILHTPHPIITGGGQEFGLRSGTENVPFVVGFAKAVELAQKNREKESVRIAKLRENLWQGIKKIYLNAEINGADVLGVLNAIAKNGLNERSDRTARTLQRLPNFLNVYLPGIESQFFLTKLDLAGIAASSGSACRARALTPSYVIEALGHSKERAKQSVRFTLGKYTTKAEIDKVISVLDTFQRQ